MIPKAIGSGIPLAIFCAALLTGCCPSGVDVLESLTLPVEQQAGCSLVPGPQVVDGPNGLTIPNPLATSDSRTVAAIAPMVTGSGPDAAAAAARAANAYAAVYECEPGGPTVRVYAVVFEEPTGAARAATLEANPDGVMYKGQLAGVVLAEEGVCQSCYDAVKARAEGAFGK